MTTFFILSKISRPWVAVLLIVVFLADCGLAVGAPGDTAVQDASQVILGVEDQEAYDSNLYRLPPGTSNISGLIGSNVSHYDFINSSTASADGTWFFAQQIIGFDVRVSDNRFAHNSELNNNSGNANALWNWRFGSQLSGQVGGSYSRALASFAESLYLGRDLVDSNGSFATGRYQIGPHWAAYGGFREGDISHSAAAAQISNYRNVTGNAALEYASSTSNTLAFEYLYSRGRYPHPFDEVLGVSFDQDYDDQTSRFVAKYTISDKTMINANFGYMERKYTNQSSTAFSGDVWRVSLQWQPTEKTQVVFAGWRELQAYQVSQSDYFVSNGASISPTWIASEKLKLSLVVSTLRQNYIIGTQAVVTIGPLRDRITTEQLDILYTPRRNWRLELIVNNERRDSNLRTFEYDDNLVTANVTFSF